MGDSLPTKLLKRSANDLLKTRYGIKFPQRQLSRLTVDQISRIMAILNEGRDD